MIDFVNQSTEAIAKLLLGKVLVHQTSTYTYSGYIVETEAYLGVEDLACHSYGGKRTPRLQSLYMQGGAIYIYSMHNHNMLNIVTKEEGNPQAVLIRAIEPTTGIEKMEENRKVNGISVSNGPGKLTKAMNITKAINGERVNEGIINIHDGKVPIHIEASPRIGIPNKGEWTSKALRYYVKGHPYVSGIRKRDIWIDSPYWL